MYGEDDAIILEERGTMNRNYYVLFQFMENPDA